MIDKFITVKFLNVIQICNIYIEHKRICNVLTRKLIYFINKNNNNNKYINIGDELKILSF